MSLLGVALYKLFRAWPVCLKVGCLQGDRSSCHFFKLCLNVLILYFVITKKVTLPPAIPFKLKILDPKPDPISAFADDYNKYFKPSIEALQFIYDTLNKFKDLSGLAINAKKNKSLYYWTTCK